MKRIGTCVAGLLLAVLVSGTAHAQGGVYRGHATGLAGATFGGDVSGTVFTAGGSMSVQEDSGWGAELDFGFAKDEASLNGGADLTTMMVNVNWIKPAGPVHPFVVIGVGTIGVHGCLLPCSSMTTTWNLGLDWGAGARLDLTDAVSLGGDVRYFVAPGSHEGTSRPENFGFWRVAFGATFSWAIVQ
jgi:opacity protein-like surface antigen